ncbi:TylF/MycF/NovP-related O-methyltransferase [Candidatus Thioglobus autotrophicus]|uniref:TylF/MycF/NovP-related O-methyltransferase n=1 Tax=Candidatus Thioglobus autotrophicus TaxID=1705394 RepID=UPI00299F0050|nr:TylF/MycF/NovP-related O-methyltransferase [Candidatus Thioglobus autotrophicus]WPE17753.1 TylF/MycF/NovP-related O-methyltransferase [Candidatus Thioglobus autotrophicus]
MKFINYDVENKWDYEIGYYLTCDNSRIAKSLNQYELYKKIINIPGDIVECGVYKGGSLIRMATYRDTLEVNMSRKIIAFDAFGSFPRVESKIDDNFIDQFESEGGEGIAISELKECLEYKNIKNIELIKGDINSTLEGYIVKNPALKVALLHIDVDVEKPTKTILKHLYERVVPGGLIVLDDYGVIHGETKAVDDFFADMGVSIQKLPFSKTPAFIVKR